MQSKSQTIAKTTKSKHTTTQNAPLYHKDILRCLTLATSLFILVALTSIFPTGTLGTYLSNFLLNLCSFCAYPLPLLPIWLITNHYLKISKHNNLWLSLGILGLLICCAILTSAGTLGAASNELLTHYLGLPGKVLTLTTLAFSSFVLVWQRPFALPKFQKQSIPKIKSTPISYSEIFTPSKQPSLSPQTAQTKERSKDLIAALKSFGIEGSIVDVQVGPVVSTFAFKASGGTRQAKIFSLSKDLALEMRVETLSVIQLPELQAIGFQVPNDKPETILFADLVNQPEFQQMKDPLKFIVGCDVAGNIACESLSKLPHLLIAGSTGSGKSIGIHCFLCSLLLSPDRVNMRLVLIDPKMLELAPYGGLPNLLHPIITDENVALAMMDELVEQMNLRYKMMAESKTRDISGFNQIWKNKSVGEKNRFIEKYRFLTHDPLPYIVLVIDEYAELALMTNKKIELPLVQLAQKSRAAGIHIVLSTQRPSIDVITGLIKANFPARLSYKVASGIDSRTIMNQLGAEKLLGRGDLLFYKPGFSQAKRFHGPYVDEQSVERLVQNLQLSASKSAS